MNRPRLWIMKITPGEPWRTKEVFDGLFTGDNPKNIFGWSGREEGRFEQFMGHWNSMKPRDVVAVMQGLNTTVGAVVITADPFIGKPGWPDWFEYRREAELIKKFSPPLTHRVSTNQDRILTFPFLARSGH